MKTLIQVERRFQSQVPQTLSERLGVDLASLPQERLIEYASLCRDFEFGAFESIPPEERKVIFVVGVGVAQKKIHDIAELGSQYNRLIKILQFRLDKLVTDHLDGITSLPYATKVLSLLTKEIIVILEEGSKRNLLKRGSRRLRSIR
ncbi:MAG: hypothetical protein BroJett025_09320 [Patescibacteria group bacterium]|nr:MAG: hypothetical protein BroJett025_09320 [Patescibacteria group bacterium]